MATFPITPLPLPAGATSPPNRIDITNMTNEDPKCFKLFINALRTLQKISDFDDQFSYFRLAAIHGMPFVGWDGEEPYPKRTWENFCVHNEITFPTWHRVYMLLFERCLYNVMPKESERDSFRLPLWDWAAWVQGTQEYGVPPVIATEYLPDDTQMNPLWQFSNPKTDSAGNPLPMNDRSMNEGPGKDYRIPNTDDVGRKFGPCKVTSRHGNPTDKNWVNGEFGIQDLNDTLNSPPWNHGYIDSIGDMVFRVLNYPYGKYSDFASAKYSGQKNGDPTFLSLEMIHNNLHDFIGGGVDQCTDDGHMAHIEVAAFDPIFWLHHCYIDGLFALWQSKNSMWFNDLTPDDPKPTDGLKPFHTDTNKTLFTSNDVRDIGKLNYSYPQLPDDGVNAQHTKFRKALKDSGLAGAMDWDYVVNIVYDRYTLDGPYRILFFFSPDIASDTGSNALRAHQSLVGSLYTFSGSNTRACTNCEKQKNAGILSRGQVALTRHLLAHAKANPQNGLTLDPNDVNKFLVDNLHWKVVTASGQVVGTSQTPADQQDPRLQSLKIYAVKGRVVYGNDTTPTKYLREMYETMDEPTRGKFMGGAN